MLKVLTSSLQSFLKNPLLLVQAAIVTVLAYVPWLLSVPYLVSFIGKGLILEEIPDGLAVEVLFKFFIQYSTELTAILFLALFSSVLNLWLLFSLANLLKGKKVFESMKLGLGKLNEILKTVVFFLAVTVLYTVLSLIVITLTSWLGLVGFILFLLWSLFGIYLWLKLMFLPVAMAVKEKVLKDALKESWKLTGKKFFSVVALVVVLAVIGVVFSRLGGYLSDLVLDEIVSALVFLFFVWLSNTYANLALLYFYQNS